MADKLLNIKEASEWATNYIGKNVVMKCCYASFNIGNVEIWSSELYLEKKSVLIEVEESIEEIAEETLIASELWNFLSGIENTMEEILEIINAISTVNFLTKYQLIKDNTKRNTPKYLTQIQEWNLFSEISLIGNNHVIQENLNTRDLIRSFNKTVFDSKGNYNWDRYNTLKELI